MTIQSFFLVVSQVFVKFVIKDIDIYPIKFSLFVKCLANYFFWLGLLSFMISAGIWIYVLKNFEFNIAYPLVSISYIFSIFVSYFLFREKIVIKTILGILFIITGVILISFSKKSI
jgi:drug/metabolite transporter (DMT)-like permease